MSTYNGPFFYHQLGYQDHTICGEMLQRGYGSGAILSPRDFNQWPHLLGSTADQYRSTDAELLVDPQAYDPHEIIPDVDTSVDGTEILSDRGILAPFIGEQLVKQQELGVTKYLVPCVATQSISNSWLDILINSAGIARELVDEAFNEDIPLFASVAIHVSEIQSEEHRGRLLETITRLKKVVDGVYLVVSDMRPNEDDISSLFGVLDLIFWLKWQGLEVVLGYSAPWAMLAFPLGLDVFASGGRKNRQSHRFTDWRGEQPTGGGGPKRYHDLWSSEIMDFIRYPDDAEIIQRYPDLWNVFDEESPYSPPLEDNPNVVYQSQRWRRRTSFQDFSFKLIKLAEEFRGLGLPDRIDLVRQKLDLAQERQEAIADILARRPSNHFRAWREAFDAYLSAVEDDLFLEFD